MTTNISLQAKMDKATFDRFLELAVYATDATSIPLKLFALYIVICYTSKRMHQVSLLILNEMLWNLLANLLYCLGNMIPMMPLQCFKFEGPASYLMDAEFGGHLFLKLLFLIVTQCGVAIVLSFQFRYLAICHSEKVKSVHPACGYVYCISLHLLFSAFYLFTIQQWEISLHDYPNQAEIDGKALFCYAPNGTNKTLFLFGLFAIFTVFLIIAVTPLVLSFFHLKKQEAFLHKTTLKMQRKILWNLIKLAAVPVLMGGFPILIGSVFTYYTHWHGAREIFGVLMIVMLNHGSVYGIVTLCLFSDYRKAVKRTLARVGWKSSSVYVTSAATITGPVRINVVKVK
ncbi:hypothetical protein L596_009331 [Steinernema carpocapsae]|uniref:G-protein coupled receptors family 1 profile domain-containing protein n=1 Tax=Steinernema carpocapsae TaxID=34508 RepID=A0A4U5PF13_STECR|nr:hypothetical protein L596_009331 [Steinernema carpocapsae]